MGKDPRRWAVALAGVCAYLDLYAPQSLLPMLAGEFHASTATVGLTITMTTLAVAIVAPFTGALADTLGRKAIIVPAVFLLAVPTVLIALSASLPLILLWRFVQGLFMPAIFATTVAYIGDEWDREDVPSVTALYMSGAVLGGFLGRFLTGLVAEHGGWPQAFLLLTALNIVCGIAIWRWLPPARRFRRIGGLGSSLASFGRHLSDPRLLAAYAVGFAVLFSLVGTFTYVNFHLAAAPYSLSPGALGSVFLVYLLGVVTTPVSGRLVQRLGLRGALAVAVSLAIAGLLLTLAPSLPVIILGLAVCSTGVFICQSVSTTYISFTVDRGRSAAFGLYVTIYYLGGSLGAILPSLIWADWGWPGCVALLVLGQAVGLAIGLIFWRTPGREAAPASQPLAATAES
jgi:predicted MFS family arabinose efflux permease